MLLAIALALALAAPTGAAAADEAQAIALLRLDTDGIEGDALQEALQLRLPALQVVDHAVADASLSSGQLYVHVVHAAGAPLRLTLIAADGRGYDRSIDPADDPPERVAAAAIANLVFAIEAGLPPDHEDASLPPADARTTREAAPPTTTEEAAPAPTDPPRAPFELGLGAAPGALLGPGSPRGADVFAAWTGALTLTLRDPRGRAARLALRGGGRRSAEYGLTRLRVGLGGGMLWRVSTLEIELAAMVTIEPWWVTRGGALERPYRAGEPRTPWLLGGEARLAVGHAFTAAGRRWRAGPWLALAGSLTLDGGGGAPRIASVDGDLLFRLGAFELAGGVEVVAWFDLRRGRR